MKSAEITGIHYVHLYGQDGGIWHQAVKTFFSPLNVHAIGETESLVDAVVVLEIDDVD